MVGVGGVSGLARAGLTARAAQPQRLQPSTANAFYIVTPLVVGAMVYRIIRNNNGDATTPPASIGTSFQPWRLAGVGWMAQPNGDAANPAFWWSDDAGSQDIALLFGGVYGGSYHGGEAASVNQVLANGVPVADITQVQTASQFALRHTSTITWSIGNTATVTDYLMAFNADGSISETCPVSSALSFTESFVGMLIGNDAGYSEARINDFGVTVPLVWGRAILRSANDVTIRHPATGRWLRQASTAPAISGYSRTEFRNGARAKLYHRFAGVLGTQVIQRNLSFGQGWFGSGLAMGANLISNGDFSGGLAGWSVQAGSSAAVASGELRLTRQAAAESRVMQGFTAVVGGIYLFSGSITANADVGLNYGISSNSNFSTSSPAPPVMQSPYLDGSATVSNMHLFVADRTTHYVMARQAAGTAGQVGAMDSLALYRLG